MKRIFLSLPMNGRSDEAIKNTIAKMKKVLTAMFDGEDIEFVDNHLLEEECILISKKFEDIVGEIKNEKLIYLGYAVQKMASCDYIASIDSRVLYTGEYKINGTFVEADVAMRYGIKQITLDDPEGDIYLPDMRRKVELGCEVHTKDTEGHEINY